MTERMGSSQSPRDRVLWLLTNNRGRITRARLRAHTGMRYALLDFILLELYREGRIKMEDNIITLVYQLLILRFKGMIIWRFEIISFLWYKPKFGYLAKAG